MKNKRPTTILAILKNNEKLESELEMNGDEAGTMNKEEADAFWIAIGEALETNTNCHSLDLDHCGLEDSHVSSLCAGLKEKLGHSNFTFGVQQNW